MGSYTVGPCECCGPSICGGNFWLFDALGYTFSQVQVTVSFQEGDFSGLGERTDGRYQVPSNIPSPLPLSGTYLFDVGLHFQDRTPVSNAFIFNYAEKTSPKLVTEREDGIPTRVSLDGIRPNPISDPIYNVPGWTVTKLCSSTNFFSVTASCFTHSVSKNYAIRDTPTNSTPPACFGSVNSCFGVERDATGLYVNWSPVRELGNGKWLVAGDSKTSPIHDKAWGNNPFTAEVSLSLI